MQKKIGLAPTSFNDKECLFTFIYLGKENYFIPCKYNINLTNYEYIKAVTKTRLYMVTLMHSILQILE